MKLKASDWGLVLIKDIIATILVLFLFVGACMAIQPQWQTINWLKESQWLWQHRPIAIGIISLGSAMIWLWTLYTIYEHALLHLVTAEVVRMSAHVFDGATQQLPVRVHSRHMRPLLKSINGVFDAAQTAQLQGKAIEKSKDEMIGNISHDLRTPLTALIGYLGLVKMDSSSDNVEKYVGIAFDKAEHMRSLVEDLYEYVQVNGSDFKMQLHFAPLDLTAMLNQLAVNYELESKENQIVVSAVTSQDRIEMVGDQNRLARVFMNLISNAFKYGEGATFIRLSAQIISPEMVEVRVENNGQPIPAEALNRVFDRFYRVESSRNLNTGGSGLGLAIVSGIIEGHGGNVRVESNSDLTSFVIQLPLQPEA
ncbi:HAMP domain-containing histidine kinase [Weissella diestrammenae]|uniref:histidine kinase n=1 Tax=Weissella diestrammenae TaxID=1162633 RepID=A0A7G9T740_9LACO|nr:HAMP domain-containing sensor histidine kinase [Weissella diestrammenae]MCM0582486.1 HAMP domain-containing histidine kinase [Weissella diestrammenae]QNN75915.1 HAMP domain-containing histidine kinase [Weissella diestrammenae]